MTIVYQPMANDSSKTSTLTAGMIQGGRGAQPPFQALELTSVLQTTLDLDELITLFVRELQAHVDFDGLRYLHPPLGLDILDGKQARNNIAYNLTISEQNLGEFTFYRARAFRNPEITTLENMLAALFYPLRNTLEYRRVLHQSLTDPLTGANNRAAMDMVLKRELQLAQRKTMPLAIILLDIDHFKQVNDTYGHPAGDHCLQAVANCIQETIRGSDLYFRCGGEEFLVLLSQTEPTGANLLAERIREGVAHLSLPAVGGHHLTISLGVTNLRQDDTVESLYTRADSGLYKAKHSGRNRVVSV